jgi:3'-phosphoadenosine 5'-phosphosulfate sulfotransferase (PAPS reductase)/FAD synthetase
LQLTTEEVARLSRPERQERVKALIERSLEIVDLSLATHLDGKELVGRVALFSGGDDSTTLVHLMHTRGLVDYAAHANTTVGVEETRQFVRDTCAAWGLPLIEKYPPTSYRDLVLDQGFPGPAQHFKMYQRLKERCLRQVRNDLVKNSRQERVLFIAGRRRDESMRRADVPLHERTGSIIWASPLAEWTKLDLNQYRLMEGNVPRNPASALIHMSGECLCGSFAKAGELDMVAEWFPQAAQEIRAIEAELAGRTDLNPERCKWGWGAYRDQKKSKVGPLCSSCGVPDHG